MPDLVEVWEDVEDKATYFVVKAEELPEWFGEYRPHQTQAIAHIMDSFKRVDLVVLDAPTGSGKTLIGESIRQEMKVKGLYTCSTKTLQDQFLSDYPYAKVLKGRGNYPTEIYQPWPATCEDCEWQKEVHESCSYCHSKKTCPYQVAKNRARVARLAVLNTSYFLAALNAPGAEQLTGRPLVILDEADTLEDELMRHVTLSIGKRVIAKYKLGVPEKVTVATSWGDWLTKADVKLTILSMKDNDKKEQDYLDRLVTKVRFLKRNIERIVYTGDRDNVEFKPITVDWIGKNLLFSHGEKFLLMSATVISPDEMVGSLGWTKPFETVKLDSTFPVASRPVRVIPIADMSRKANERDELLRGIRRVLTHHPGERVLVHTVSYELCSLIRSDIRDRPVFSYGQASDRATAISQFIATDGAVLVAPSLERGVDLPGDKCRVIVVAKVPFPFLGDKQVSTRLYGTRGGQEWYGTRTVRSLVQMTGRGMRSEEDRCVTYILDKQFLGLWNKNRRLFPKWWSEALDWRFVLP